MKYFFVEIEESEGKSVHITPILIAVDGDVDAYIRNVLEHWYDDGEAVIDEEGKVHCFNEEISVSEWFRREIPFEHFKIMGLYLSIFGD